MVVATRESWPCRGCKRSSTLCVVGEAGEDPDMLTAYVWTCECGAVNKIKGEAWDLQDHGECPDGSIRATGPR